MALGVGESRLQTEFEAARKTARTRFAEADADGNRLLDRAEASRSTFAPLPKPIRDPAPLRRASFDQLPQYRAYSPGSTTAVTDSVLLVYRDLR